MALQAGPRLSPKRITKRMAALLYKKSECRFQGKSFGNTSLPGGQAVRILLFWAFWLLLHSSLASSCKHVKFLVPGQDTSRHWRMNVFFLYQAGLFQNVTPRFFALAQLSQELQLRRLMTTQSPLTQTSPNKLLRKPLQLTFWFKHIKLNFENTFTNIYQQPGKPEQKPNANPLLYGQFSRLPSAAKLVLFMIFCFSLRLLLATDALSVDLSQKLSRVCAIIGTGGMRLEELPKQAQKRRWWQKATAFATLSASMRNKIAR